MLKNFGKVMNDGQIKKNAYKNKYLGFIFIPEKYVKWAIRNAIIYRVFGPLFSPLRDPFFFLATKKKQNKNKQTNDKTKQKLSSARMAKVSPHRPTYARGFVRQTLFFSWP